MKRVTLTEYKRAKKIVDLYEKQNQDKPIWMTSYEAYLEEATNAMNELLNDAEFIRKEQVMYPNVDIPKTIERSFDLYWGTTDGFENKKKKNAFHINWKSTYKKTMYMNKIYKSRDWKQNIDDKLSHVNSGKTLDELTYGKR
jgi:hypothetical protein